LRINVYSILALLSINVYSILALLSDVAFIWWPMIG
jgi:hypothetical protein